MAKRLLSKYERVATAFAEFAAGPGWSNTPVIAIIYDSRDGSLRREWIQPEDQTDDMRLLYRTSQAAHGAMTAAVTRADLGKVKR